MDARTSDRHHTHHAPVSAAFLELVRVMIPPFSSAPHASSSTTPAALLDQKEDWTRSARHITRLQPKDDAAKKAMRKEPAGKQNAEG